MKSQTRTHLLLALFLALACVTGYFMVRAVQEGMVSSMGYDYKSNELILHNQPLNEGFESNVNMHPYYFPIMADQPQVFPIGFSIHPSKITSDVPPKTRLLAPLVPGDPSTYVYHTEEAYYDMYKSSYFAMTRLKGGWDCLRHYEILACGCIPLFIDLDKCPPRTMTFFPKHIIQETNALYETICAAPDPLRFAKDLDLESKYIRPLLEYTRQILTNAAMASYVLRCADVVRRPVRNVLFLSGNIGPDYLRCTTLVGFKELLGAACHDVPRVPHIYTDYPDDQVKQLYGRGMSYTRLVSPDTHDNTRDATVEEDIRLHRYDIVVYGSFHRGMPYWNLVLASYATRDIVMICGEDLHVCSAQTYVDMGCVVLVREL
jgi:hypothetical protein